MSDRLADDLLKGARHIAHELGCSEREAYHLAERKLIPAFKIGGRIYARRSELRQAFSSTAAAE
jgi:hypothetical protein